MTVSAQRSSSVPGQSRVVVENPSPEVDGGRFPVKRVAGDTMVVEADVFSDGHDALAVRLLHRAPDASAWAEAPMTHVGNDRWRGEFVVAKPGPYRYTVEAWADRLRTWRRDLERRAEAQQDLSAEFPVGAQILAEAAERLGRPRGGRLAELAARLSAGGRPGPDGRRALSLGDEVLAAWEEAGDRRWAVRYPRELVVEVDGERARSSAWYEVFPRSCAPLPGRHGTLRDLEAQLPRIADLGFTVVYLPPVHPIGRTHRKGRNNSVRPEPDAPGSPWAIGAAEGGHDAIHPDLGTLEDFRRLVDRARALGLEIALDVAFQCSPDHPWVADHPQWFRHRPDGTIQHAENPPKMYQDIYPFDFETPDWRALWEALKAVFDFWIGHGVRTFRVDNPHTKPFAFWEWLIADLRRRHPDVLLLSEAFTRPKIMYRLAKLGFTHSYTYFTWRNTKAELTHYFTELTRGPPRDFFRPHVWPNTPDILPAYLQQGGPAAFRTRFLLAATLGSNYGIYGPAFERCEHRPLAPGSEEYLDSEKYELRHWDPAREPNLPALIKLVNRVRSDHPCLRRDDGLRFHDTDNPELLAYSKTTPDGADLILVVVNLDPTHKQAGATQLDLPSLGLGPDEPFTVHDLLSGQSYPWRGPRNYVELDPQKAAGHVFTLTPSRTQG